MTLIDFGLWIGITGGASSQFHCEKLAIIHEPTGPADATICGGKQRIRQVYTSKGHVMDITIVPVTEGKESKHFLLKYDGEDWFNVT